MGAAVLIFLLFGSSDVPAPASKPLPELDAANPHGLDQSASCGLRCCLFLDQYLGGHRTFEEVLAMTPVSSRGTNLEDLAGVLRSFDYQVTAERASAASLKSLASPALLAVRRPGGDHFVVAIKYDRASDSFLVFDPPRKLTWVSCKALESRYRDYALIVSSGRHDDPSNWTSHVGCLSEAQCTLKRQ
jgi:ABC-type bacteriocin/lantibiotic exporter with double-glycine peptidase domain